jgi:hypothetical protein
MKCPHCDSKTITEELQETNFPYGADASFPCQVIVLKCDTCEATWLDERAEEACVLAMFRYEKSIHIRRTIFTSDDERALWNQA